MSFSKGITQVNKLDIVRMYEAGIRAAVIAKQYKISRQRVWQILKEFPGVKMRPSGGRGKG